MKIEAVKGSILDLCVDAIVNPANSGGRMGGGVAKVIKNAGGVEIEKDAMAKAPIAVGDAIMTTAGRLAARHVIHAPTMVKPAERTTVEKVRAATTAALRCADVAGLKSIAFPGMGTGVGKVKPADAAASMVAAIRDFRASALQKVVLVDVTSDMVSAFEDAIR